MKNKRIDNLEIRLDPVKSSASKLFFQVIKIGKDRFKMIGTAIDKEDNFRAFSYFTTSQVDAKTAIMSEYAYR